MNKPVKEYDIKRYDLSTDRSLKAYSAADEYLLQTFKNLDEKPDQIAIFHDRFGYLTCHLKKYKPTVILTNKSQEKAILANLSFNKLPPPVFKNPLTPFEKNIDLVLLKIPKSLALFQFFIEQISKYSSDNVRVVTAFMTRHFSPRFLEIAGKYFIEVEQSRAVKKARLMILSKKKPTVQLDLIDALIYKNKIYKQYWGVFSARHIDYATQYFLEHLQLKKEDKTILDLASGNGIIAGEIAAQLPNATIHLMDDSYLAVESGKLNLPGENIHHHFNNDLTIFEEDTFDLIVTNPPFHFEYEINIKIPLQLFKESYRCLKAGGNLQIVANKHLNYLTHLKTLFSVAEILDENDKYVVYKCEK